jgi:hypothetical protein
MNQTITIEVAPGELIDKLTILEIKRARIEDAQKRANVETEFNVLDTVRRGLPQSPELDRLTDALRAVNLTLWDIEDQIRDCERRHDFGPVFIELARSVYKTNDRRAELKRQINERLGSRLMEEKSYHAY